MRRSLAFLILSLVKIISSLFYKGTFTWLTARPENPWTAAKLLVFLNHTSLYEPLYVQVLPFSFIWHLAGNISVPGADITLERPIVGRFWKLMIPQIASVSRKKDSTWSTFLQNIKPNDTIVIAAEGRMKRLDGLDKFGRPMTVRGGVADIIEGLESGGMILCLSGGLHHVQTPGEKLPRFFKEIKMNLIYIDLKEYKAKFPGSSRERKINMVQDLQQRLEKDCPTWT